MDMTYDMIVVLSIFWNKNDTVMHQSRTVEAAEEESGEDIRNTSPFDLISANIQQLLIFHKF